MELDYFGYDVVVHPRIEIEHGIAEDDVIAAWENALPLKRRNEPRNSLGNDEYVTVGFDTKGRAVELVATPYPVEHFWLVYHGVRPATRGFITEYKRIGG